MIDVKVFETVDAITPHHHGVRVVELTRAPDQLDVLAGRVGLSRSEYIRRRLTQEARRARTPVTVEHFR
ncbi:MAG TPA: hypothetical protein VE197_10365, partial [Mycobacterium sp.]|nr:hypothetical protein [Mycobacterium sp.]